MFVWTRMSQSLAQRRAARDANVPISDSFTLILKQDDPDALGKEVWQLNGVQLWRLTVGINIGDELINREFPITWTSEQPITVFEASTGPSGVPAASYYAGYEPKGG
jgi:hypothetical protein